jgi:hypothetical protein
VDYIITFENYFTNDQVFMPFLRSDYVFKKQKTPAKQSGGSFCLKETFILENIT